MFNPFYSYASRFHIKFYIYIYIYIKLPQSANLLSWLQAFGFPVSYSTIVKTVGALLVAFGTKIVLEELSIFK